MRVRQQVRDLAIISVLLANLVAASGCGSGPTTAADTDRQAIGRALFENAPAADGEPAWSVVIAAFRGTDRDRNAALWLDRVRTAGGLPEARLDTRGKGVIAIAIGRFAGPDDPEAQQTLQRVRAAEIEGRRPFAGAFLAPPILDANQGPLAELDLRNARAVHGETAEYTLQIAVYDPGPNPRDRDQREIRRTAEQAAVQLRQDGEMAFYFHGPNTSSVTIGTFAERDVAGVFGTGPAVRDLRARHPNMLVNGQSMRRAGGSFVPTEIVRIPN